MKKILAKAKAGIGNKLDIESRLLFKNSTWIFISNFIGIGLAFLRSVLVARILGAETFGSYAIIVAFVGVIQEFLNLNLGTALIKFGAVYHHDNRIDKLTALVKKCLKICSVMLLLSIAIVVLLSQFFYSTFISVPGMELFITLYAVAAGTRYFNSISNGILRLYYKFRLNSLIQIVMDIVESLLIILALLVYGKNLEMFFGTVILAAFLNGFICNLMAFWELRNEFRPLLGSRSDLIDDDMRAITKFVFGNSLGNSLKSIMSQGDVLLLGALAGSAQVAFYAVAKKLAYSILVLTDPLMNSIFPQFSKLLAAKKHAEIRDMLKRITLTVLIPSVVFMILAYFLNEWAIVLVFGKDYSPAAQPFIWLLAGAVFGSVTFWTLPLVQSMGLVGLRILVYSIAIIAGASIALFLVPIYKATGMAMALLCANILINFTFIYHSNRKMSSIVLQHASA